MNRKRAGGFTLLEVLAALAIMAIAIFPLLQVVQESLTDTHDAKFATLCASRIRGLLSEITRSAKPGSTGSGDLSSMTDEEGYDDRFAYANIRYEWECQSADLSTDVTPVAQQSEEEKAENDEKKRNAEQADREESADAAIDDRFRARYVRIMFNYELENGEEKEIVMETYIPPLPNEKKKEQEQNGRSDLVPPNTGRN